VKPEKAKTRYLPDFSMAVAPHHGDTGERQSDIWVEALRATSQHMHGILPTSLAAATVQKRIAVLIPCFNEAASIAGVVADLFEAMPDARIVVFDNGSTDETIAFAKIAGAEVHCERRRGKGHVVRRMFADIDADIYVMIDGDGTYDAKAVTKLVEKVADGTADMVVGGRTNIGIEAHRKGHALGNRLFSMFYRILFGDESLDIFSGYRAFSRRFVKSFPALSNGFEVETELAVHASQLKLPVFEIELPYGKRVQGSISKLRTFSDGFKILRTFAYLMKETRPALFFGILAAANALASVALAAPVIQTFLATGLVPRLPTAILCVGLMLVACLLGTCGLILDSLARSRIEQKRILYLAVQPSHV